MNKQEKITHIERFVREIHKDYDSGHDWWHLKRVRNMANYINRVEKLADPFMVEVAALLHDSADSKFSGTDRENGLTLIGKFLDEHGMSDIKPGILEIIKKVSFSSNYKADINDHLLMIIQDADRIDAIGAIGVARAFNYGGYRNNKIYDPSNETDGRQPNPGQDKNPSTIRHFYDKLLVLKDLMNTAIGKQIAEERHVFLETFLSHFYQEWNFPAVS